MFLKAERDLKQRLIMLRIESNQTFWVLTLTKLIKR